MADKKNNVKVKKKKDTTKNQLEGKTEKQPWEMTSKEYKRQFIAEEKAHPDYDKPMAQKELTADRVLDLRYIPANEWKEIVKDIRNNYEELGIAKAESKHITSKVVRKWLEATVGDYSGLIDKKGKYHPLLTDSYSKEPWHKLYVKDAISKGKSVPRKVLEEYKGEAWVNKALVKYKTAKEKSESTSVEEKKGGSIMERKVTEASVRLDGKAKNGEVIGLIDIYRVLCDIKEILEKTKGYEGLYKENEERTAIIQKGKRKMTKEEKEAKKKSLAEKMPYTKEELDNMKTIDLRMLASALKINSFGLRPNTLRKMIWTMSEKMLIDEKEKKEGKKKNKKKEDLKKRY